MTSNLHKMDFENRRFMQRIDDLLEQLKVVQREKDELKERSKIIQQEFKVKEYQIAYLGTNISNLSLIHI